MRFFTGLHSERLSEVETELYRTIDEQQGKREAVRQIREFAVRFELGSELDFAGQIENNNRELLDAEARRQQLENERAARIHPTDSLRERLRTMGAQIFELVSAIGATESAIAEQRALRAELITTKIKADRTEKAGQLLEGVEYLASLGNGDATQFLLIDSDLIEPESELEGFVQRHMAGNRNAPSLIPYYSGP